MGVLFRLPEPAPSTDGALAGLTPPAAFSPSSHTPVAGVKRPLTAAAYQVKINEPAQVAVMRDRQQSTRGWQTAAFDAWESVGEIGYGFGLIAALISRVRIYVGAITDLARPPAPVGEVSDLTPGLAIAAQAALDRLVRGSTYGISGLLSDLTLNFAITGEAYLIQTPEEPDQLAQDGTTVSIPETWSIRSIEEVQVNPDSKVYLRPARSTSGTSTTGLNPSTLGLVPLRPTSYVGRLYRPSPRFSSEAISSLKQVLPQVEELHLLQQMFRGTTLSRLNAGLLYLPDGLHASTPAGASTEIEEDSFEDDLIDAMTIPIQDPASAASVVPLIVRGPAELGEKIKHFTFERAYDEHLVARADRVLERIMQGIDLPKDVVSGLANVKYSNAVVIEESLLKSHIEPLVLLICDALTRAYIRPYLVGAAFTVEQAERITLWFDPADIIARPNKANESNDGYDRNILSASAWRRAHGFDESAAPDPTEVVLKFLLEHGQVTPELTESLLRVIAPLIMDDARQATAAASPNPLPVEVQQALGLPPSANPTAEQNPTPGQPPPAPGTVNDTVPPASAPPTNEPPPAPPAPIPGVPA